MTYDPSRPGLVGPHRLDNLTADWVGDKTAGGAANLQQFMDARRKCRGNVADVTARNALPSPQAGQWVLVESVNGMPRLDVYIDATRGWRPLSGDGGAPVITTFPHTITSDQKTIVCANSLNAVSNVFLPQDPLFNQEHRVKDGRGDSSVYKIVVQTSDGSLIDGEASIDMDTDRLSLTFVWTGPTYGWVIV